MSVSAGRRAYPDRFHLEAVCFSTCVDEGIHINGVAIATFMLVILALIIMFIFLTMFLFAAIVVIFFGKYGRR